MVQKEVPIGDTLMDVMSRIAEKHQSTQELRKSSKYDPYLTYIAEHVPPDLAATLMTDHRVMLDFEDWQYAVTRCKNYKTTDEGFAEYLKTTRLPPIFRKATHIDWPKKIWEKAGSSESLFLSGKPGTGKTHLAASIIAENYLQFSPRPYYNESRSQWMSTRLTVPLFVTVPQLLVRFRATFKDENTTETDLLQEYCQSRLTIFDDMGSEKISEWSLQMLYLIVDHRYTNLLPTIITSNLTLEEIGTTISDRIASRIAGMCEIISLKGDDRRIKRRA